MLKHSRCERVQKVIKTLIVTSTLINVELVFAERVIIDDPQVSGYALDVCWAWGSSCGKPAADAYCRSKGFVEAVDFDVVDDSPPTRVISTRQICDHPTCDRIVTVVCTDRRRTPRYHDDGR